MVIPGPMVDMEASQVAQNFQMRMESQGINMEQYFQFTGQSLDAMVEDAKPQALKRIQTRLVLEKIAETEDIQVSDEELDEELGKMAASYGMELDKLKETLNEETKDQIRKDVAVQKAVTLVAEAAKEI